MTSTTGQKADDPGVHLALRAALRWQAVTVAWMIVEALASFWAGIAARSLLLVTFGADSVIELVSAAVVFRWLQRQAHSQNDTAGTVERLEGKVARIAGCLLYALAAYVVLQGAYGLMRRHTAETSWFGLAIAAIAALAMPMVAWIKLRLADRIGSRALRADAVETLACAYLAWVLLAGLAANALLHWWWLDTAAALVIVPFLLKEAHEAIRGE